MTTKRISRPKYVDIHFAVKHSNTGCADLFLLAHSDRDPVDADHYLHLLLLHCLRLELKLKQRKEHILLSAAFNEPKPQ